jgi:N-acetylglucosamine kinase-like BadF-type ATPase
MRLLWGKGKGMAYYLCADQGGTKTQVIIIDKNGGVIGAARGEGAPPYYSDPGNASTGTIRKLAEQILAEAGLPRGCLTAALCGVICLDWPFEKPLHTRRLQEGLHIQDATAVSDSIIALRAGTTAPNRCVICAGTGLNMAAQTALGREFVYGCYIPMRIMGGLALGQQVIDAVTEAETGVRGPTSLTEVLLAFTGYPTVEGFLTDSSTGQGGLAVQGLVPGLVREAHAGDGAAREILDGFAAELVKYTGAMLRRMELTETETDLVFTGGLFKEPGKYLYQRVVDALVPIFPYLRYVNAKREPVCGAALYMLERHYGGNIPLEVTKNFLRDCEKRGLCRY